ncbi:transcriptional regulator [Dulcicalothrix desertica PCC 7102]|uniref:Transcriptional regulator n=1 Tax=Dulcicalothrix desertica PCC 7102 TaxID=232991 RepID=A0A3S1AGD4_9CYAN|nr:helix-turn-helix transcriptional regulator [Dulcicalothrix desertica]RUT00219.1 transcriptional regulator [Dulcicalothrix desertica PCC 7102]TWH55687.1 Xre family transcriptional regulator [Dulcicalothrix desertica PCC 7102]
MNQEDKVTTSSGNVFKDLGLPNPEERLLKAQLARKISEAISKLNLTQAQAAEVIGIDQPKISLLVRGRLSGFSTDRLLDYLNRLGSDIEIRVGEPKLEKVQKQEIASTIVY